MRTGELEVLLAGHEPAALPVHVIGRKAGSAGPEGARLHDFAVPWLRRPLCAGPEKESADRWAAATR